MEISQRHMATFDKILDTTQELIQHRGYNAVSFNHIADVVGIKKPSILHHFANKEALGKALVIRYREQFEAALKPFRFTAEESMLDAFDQYLIPYRAFSDDGQKVCLCGALAGEYLSVPDDVQKEVERFFRFNVSWLKKMILCGRKTGQFIDGRSAVSLAHFILNELQGALIIKRAIGGKPNPIDDVIDQIKQILIDTG